MLGVRSPGSRNLFHAIVIAGAGLGGGCSRALSNNGDASLDRPAQAGADAGSDAGSNDRSRDGAGNLDVAVDTDVGPPHNCSCRLDGSGTCCACSCESGEPLDGGLCYPCYV
jgi:hypothetical protein